MIVFLRFYFYLPFRMLCLMKSIKTWLQVFLILFCLSFLVVLPAQQNPLISDESEISVNLNSQETNNSEENTSTASIIKRSEGNFVSGYLYLRVFMILGFLIVLIYFTLKFLRRVSLQNPQLKGIGNGIKILASQVLHGDQIIHVVEVGEECYLLGSSPGGIQLLDHYKDKEIKDKILLEVTQKTEIFQKAGSALDFLQLIRNRLGGFNNVDHTKEQVIRKSETNSQINTATKIDDTENNSSTVAQEFSAPLVHTGEYRKRLRSAAEVLKEKEKS